ncbi:MAG: NAD(P)-dependent glycerol-3-phosphate dehydrogenase [Chloroflexi bacterium]|nr:NAD(P)-dependent glycerol-3-phosphate dehydrogenase [Chloroflexota bacterium]
MLAKKGLGMALWARTPQEAQELNLRRENQRFIPGLIFPENLVVASSLEEAMRQAQFVILAVPSRSMRQNLETIKPALVRGMVIVTATKGLEEERCLRMSQVIQEVLGEGFPACALSGPNLAREIASGLPASTVVACRDPAVAEAVQRAVMTPRFRVYAHDDIVGVELGGALKNIIALGAGAADEMGFGENAKAGLMTRGLAEIARLGVAAGANPLTFAGLAGLGDLVATCSSRHSRNHYVGEELAKGRKLVDVLSSMKMVAEGVFTTPAARKMAKQYNVEMPITEEIYQVLFEEKDPRAAVVGLFQREPKRELDGLLEEWVERVAILNPRRGNS